MEAPYQKVENVSPNEEKDNDKKGQPAKEQREKLQ